MITKNQLKYYSSLNQKKYREQEKKFIVEGIKSVFEGINSGWVPEKVFYTPAFAITNQRLLDEISDQKLVEVNAPDFKRITDTESPQGICAAFFKKETMFDSEKISDKIIVYADNLSDPGNLGTILRTCDWFGINNILISKNSVEYLNPKVVRSSMGSIFHLNIFENIFIESLMELKTKGYKIICSDIRGKSIFDYKKDSKLIVTLSNESAGPSDEVKNVADDFLTIPSKGKAESLNVSSASAIILALLTAK